MGFPDRIERTVRIDRPLDRVWSAITTAEGLGTWFGHGAEIDLRVGGTAKLTWDSGDAAQLRIERQIRLGAGRAIEIQETLENLSASDRPIAWTQHVTLGPPYLERGRTEFRASATRSKVFEGDFGQKDAYKLNKSGLPKLAVPLIDVPQSINTISAQEMQDRAVMDLNQALKTVPGITIGAGEFRSLGTTPTIRGFVARTDMFMDGIRDYGNYYRDPFNVEAIEVLEGPAGVVFGRGSTGGVIEQDSKLPKLQPLIAGTLTGGTDSTRRATIDVNEPLTGLGEGAAFRINAMGHKAMVTDRNVVEDSRYGFAPSFSLGLGTPTRRGIWPLTQTSA